ncbi:TonB-dependent receptor domain-containing protein [Novosphingobium sp. P6W]|uniref:TonB-dependent receptor domain-containing protein n=1 Tax=Novosphingobium sp. P6W TaxID=1609758 RepID=UPI0009E50F8B|nr:TonB-dependent receptor [Novosphingobium sp. P6W]AXB79547.1 TonB-dependent receptor [Novosphingobium sp. P6W]
MLSSAVAARSPHQVSSKGRASRALRHGALLTASLLALSPVIAFAQDTAAPDAGPAGGNDIVVTGSRIRVPNATSVSPITTVNSEDLAQRGVTRLEDMLNTLPQVYADQGGGNRGGTVGASGTATINLRNLGNQRTLVLINGRRLMQGDPARSAAQAADINNVPAALVERIDVVTGGASAVYGSDALAGVVNFELKKNFEGVQLDASSGVFQHDNGNSIASVAAAAGQDVPTGSTVGGLQQSLSVTAGHNFADGRGNVTAFVNYRHIEGVGTSERDFSICNLNATAAGYSCSLSSTTYPAQFQLTNPRTGATRGSYTLDPATGNTFRTYRTSDGFNNGNTYDLQAPDERINADLLAHFEVSSAVELYGELMYMRDKADIRLSPTGVFTVPESINCSNPFLSAQQKNLMCTSVGLTDAQSATVNVSLRNAPGGSRHDYTKHTSYRAVGGVRGEIAPGWRYDAYAQYGRTNYSSRLTGDISLASFANSLRAVTNSSGQIVCENAADGCVPLNIFSTTGVTADALNYVQGTFTRTGFTEETIVSGSVTGDIGVSSPFASNPISVALGTEYRKERIGFTADSHYSSRDVAGNSGGEYPISGSFDVKELYGEVRVPLVEDRPFFKSLAVEGGARYSNYSTAGDTFAWKAGAEWSPVDAIRFRGSFQHSVRAPNLVELFGPQRVTTARLTDPCEGASPTATFAQCAQSGVTATQYGTIEPAAGQLSGVLVGGNPNLKPEKSNTKSFGVQIAPPFLRGLTLSVDYFDIKVDDLITTLPATITLSQCINAGTFCDQIQRNPATGSLVTSGYVLATSLNAGYLQTTGIDFSASAKQDLGDLVKADLGTVGFNFSGTRTNKYEVQIVPGTEAYRCDGYFGVTCGQPIPTWRHRAEFNWTAPSGAIRLAATWRYIGSTRNDRSSSATFLAGTYQPYDYKLKAVNYFDLAASFDVSGSYTLRLGVSNVFDRDPPITASTSGQTSNGAFYAGMYDSLGRYLFASVTAKL